MPVTQLPVFLIALLALCSCAAPQKAPVEYNTLLQEDFRKADILQGGDVNLSAINELRIRLHSRLRQEGDDKFAAILAAQPLMAQVSVVNIMGFTNPSDYDNFPKTKHVLSAAPKI